MSAPKRGGGGCFLFDAPLLQTSPAPFFHALVFSRPWGLTGGARFSVQKRQVKKIGAKSKSRIKYLGEGIF